METLRKVKFKLVQELKCNKQKKKFINRILNITTMKKIIYAIFLIVLIFPCKLHGQNLWLTNTSKFKPFTYDELVLQAQAKAAREAYNEKKFNEFQDKAYSCLNKKDYQGFIYYSDHALKTGWYNSQLYYDRGKAFENLNDYKRAKKEYKKAKKKGYYPAAEALKRCKQKEKMWKKLYKE